MGCGGSKAVASSAPIEKDAEDLHLDPVDFKKMKIPKFDNFLDEVEKPVNTLIDLSNGLNEVIFDIKDAAATVSQALKVEYKLQGVVSHDVVLLTFTKADGTYAASEDVVKLQQDPKVSSADVALAAALAELHASAPSGLSVANNALSGGSVDKFNAALTAFRAAVGEAYTVGVQVKNAQASGGATIEAIIMKPIFANPDSPKYELKPATLLDKAASKDAKAVFTAEATAAETAQGLGKAAKDVAGISFSIKKKKVVATFAGDVDEDAKSAVNRAVSTLNSQTFKLTKACFNANGKVSIALALVKMVEGIQDYVVKKAGTAAKNLVTISPRFELKDGDLDFDLGLKINLPEFEGLGFDDVLAMLPGKIKFVWDTITGAKSTVADYFPQFTHLKDEIERLIDSAGEVFEEPATEIKKAFPEADIVQVMKLTAAVTANLKRVKDCQRVPSTFFQTLQILKSEFEASLEEIKKVVPL